MKTSTCCQWKMVHASRQKKALAAWGMVYQTVTQLSMHVLSQLLYWGPVMTPADRNIHLHKTLMHHMDVWRCCTRHCCTRNTCLCSRELSTLPPNQASRHLTYLCQSSGCATALVAALCCRTWPYRNPMCSSTHSAATQSVPSRPCLSTYCRVALPKVCSKYAGWLFI